MLSEVTAVVFIPLTRGKVAVIDFDDFEKVRPFSWQAAKNGHRWYARAARGGKTIYMHRHLLGLSGKTRPDHKDGNGLNNRRRNLRVCSPAQNAQAFQKKRSGTTSQYRGVFWDRHNAHWGARIEKNYKKYFLGCFSKEMDAARAYDAKARELFGEFASPNFP